MTRGSGLAPSVCLASLSSYRTDADRPDRKTACCKVKPQSLPIRRILLKHAQAETGSVIAPAKRTLSWNLGANKLNEQSVSA
jgi:hypothetical protein